MLPPERRLGKVSTRPRGREGERVEEGVKVEREVAGRRERVRHHHSMLHGPAPLSVFLDLVGQGWPYSPRTQ